MTDTIELAPLNIGDILEQYKTLDAKQVKALDYLAHNMSLPQVARLVNKRVEDVRQWLENEEFRAALALVQRRAASWSYELQKNLIFLAEDKLEQILLQDYDSAPAQERREIARTARYVREMASRDNALGLTPTGGSIFIEEDSAAEIAKHIRQLEENKTNDIVAEYDILAVPSSYVIHTDTSYGVMNHNQDDDTYQCHICGGWYSDVYGHAKRTHRGISREEYNAAFRIIDQD